MSVEDRVLRLESFAADVREHTRLLTEVIRRMDERDDRHETWIDELHAAQANSDAKIAALTDAQIRTGERIGAMADAQAHADARIAALADAQIKTEGALVRMETAITRNSGDINQLTELVRQLANRQNGNGQA